MTEKANSGYLGISNFIKVEEMGTRKIPQEKYLGFVEVKEAVTEPPTLELALTVEKNSFLVGKVCQDGKSQNSFVPDALW